AYLQTLPEYRGQIVHLEHLPARPARYAGLSKPLHPALEATLKQTGSHPLYTHQAQALDSVLAGRSVVVATGTASGKSLVYNAALIQSFLEDPRSRALYLFPTQALAQDQLRGLRAMASGCCPSLYADTFDGDTPQPVRGRVKRSAQVVLTNPDMLHLGILPNHTSWSSLLRRLKYVVIDEAHVYRGVFGSHVANIVRRLRRLCRVYGSSPQFILCTATIANPGEHAERLIGQPVDVVEDDGAPRGPKDFIFWNPPVMDPHSGARRSPNREATHIFTRMVRSGIRSINFTKSRKVAELIYMYARETLGLEAPHLADRIRPYRAGYLAEDRREIERGLFQGDLLGVTATNALELGVDIGDLEGTILTGYPGSIASTWQQAGRSGRSATGHSVSVLIGLDNPLDQYLMRHPEAFFGKSPESARVNPGNPYILDQHLQSAAFEIPLAPEDEALFGAGYRETVDDLARKKLLVLRQGRYYLSADVMYPAERVNIRSTSPENYQLLDETQPAYGGRLLEIIDGATAFFQVHPGAVYLHQGFSYLVTRLDQPGRTAFAIPSDTGYYTQARELTDIRIKEVLRDKAAGTTRARLGRVTVTTQVVGFKKKRQVTEEVLGEEPLDLPTQSFETVALWFDVPPELGKLLGQEGFDFPGSLHATEHAAIGILPLFAMCDRNDIGGVSTPWHIDTQGPEVFIYDGHAGGVGIAEEGYQRLEELWARTLEIVSECPCETGCPSCVQSPKCGNNNRPLDKAGARRMLASLLGRWSPSS
ncbi:MAG: DEAD/DEAH box helicase, partial [Dehalococcoidia bacterium]|nr:DEAD/DEAH box helicase [Dehalococcoidia bacterium]